MKGKSLTPKVEPISQPEWKSAQPKYPSLPEAGISNGLLVAPSFTGKTTWLSSWILDGYQGAYARIFVFSLSALTPEWEPVKNYVESELGVDPDDEPFLFETLDEGKLASIISTQKKVIAHQKKSKHATMHAILIVLDDLASEQKFHANYGPISELYTRGRHFSSKRFANRRSGSCYLKPQGERPLDRRLQAAEPPGPGWAAARADSDLPLRRP